MSWANLGPSLLVRLARGLLPDGQINNTLEILPPVADWDFSDAQKFHSTKIWIEEPSLLVNGVTQTTSEASTTAELESAEIRSGLVFTEVEQASFEQLDGKSQPALQTVLFLPSLALGLRDFDEINAGGGRMQLQ